MGKKKGKKGKKKQPAKPQRPRPTPPKQMKNPLADLFGEMAKAGVRSMGDPGRLPGKSPVQKMTAPPENLIEHLTRLGAHFWVSEAGVTETGDVFPEPCLTVPWMALIHAEAEHAQPGTGEQKVQEVKRLMISENAKRAVEEIRQIGGEPEPRPGAAGHPDDPKDLPVSRISYAEDEDEYDLGKVQG